MRYTACIAIALTSALAAVPLATATEVSRDEYVAMVEPICKKNREANERTLKGVRAKVKAGKLKVAARQFTKAAAALRRALSELKAVPQPAADRARLTKWLGYIEIEVGLLRKAASKLKKGDKTGALFMQARLKRNANLANRQVLPFEFRYCNVDPSKLT